MACIVDQNNDEIDEISLEKLKIALSTMKNKKSCGKDGLPADILKVCDKTILNELR